MRLHDLFLRSARRWPDAVAVDVPPGFDRPQRVRTTYAELAAAVEQLAARVQPFVSNECTVAILLARDGPTLYAAQIAVLQTGAAFVCVDAAFPDAHLQHVLRDSRAVAVLTSGALRSRCLGADVPAERVLDADALLAAAEPATTSREPEWLGAQSLAYVIYTSGTTGKPKGVLIEHGGIVNLVQSGVERFGIGPGDRIAQGSSAAYDSSVEETWLALASGATVVVLDDATVRSGPDLVAWLRDERVTVLCPPPTLLRAMDCRDPARELPDLRLCYAGGEAMPQDLADRWGAALWLENGYGPTECTVTVVRGRLRPGEPVTIGTPVPGHSALLLDERLRVVARGDAGELCIAGPGVARGYLGHPEATARRFLHVDGIGRVYRTGDLVREGPDARLYYEGRIDAQIKLRGHRIELEAIEAALAACDGVREAACCVQRHGGADVLCAFVVADDGAPPPPAQELIARLGATLPAHMVPVRYGVVEALPWTVGGKLDRRALAEAPCAGVGTASRAIAAPENDTQRALAIAFAACLPGVDGIGIDDDFFALGGDSLRAAWLVTRLRGDAGLASLAVRDVYRARTVRALAESAEALRGTPDPTRKPRDRDAGLLPALLVTVGQTAWLFAVLLAAGTGAWLLGWIVLPWLVTALGVVGALLAAPLLGALGSVLYAGAAVWLTAFAKELLIGRYESGQSPVWSSFHLRHWLVVQAARLVPWGLFAGTEWQCAALRVLGARIGARVRIHRDVDLAQGGWDLLEIGDGAVLDREAHPMLVELHDGHLVAGRVQIGAGAVVGTRCSLGPGTRLHERAELAPLSFLAAGDEVPCDERWDGVPARRVGAAPAPVPVDVPGPALAPWLHAALLVGTRMLLVPGSLLTIALAVVAVLAVGLDRDSLLDWLLRDGPWSAPAGVAAVLAAVVVALPIGLLAQSLLLRWTEPVPAGTHARWSVHDVRLSVRTAVLESAGEWLSGTLFWPTWLRIAGMRVGRGAEVSTILDVLPEHTTIGAWSFLADGIYLGVPRQRGAGVTVSPTSLGAETFLGNHVVVPAGERLPDRLLLGVSTVADGANMASAPAWFGHPPFPLPRREVVTVDRRLTHEPGALRRVNRVFWESLRVLLPAGPAIVALAWFDVLAARLAGGASWPGLLFVVVPAVTLAAGVALALAVLLAKWLLLGRVRPGQHGLWSCWASRWDFHYVMWHRWGRALLSRLEGTLWLPWYLRAMGMRIGRRVVLGPGFAQVVDPDMIALGDGATVHAMFQAHSFEDRVLKIDRVAIDAFATVGRGTVVLYGARIGAGADVAPHAVVMKHELLLPRRAYAGVPTQQIPAPPPARAHEPEPARPLRVERDAALDVARGLAVLGMVFMHFLPDDGSALLALAHGRPAALFVLLAGMSWALQTQRRAGRPGLWTYTLRRALALGVLGWLFWRTLWPTEVLVPFALMLPIVVLLVRRGAGALLAAAAILLAATPIATAWLGGWVEVDCLDDGTHLANHELGWATLRYFVFDGSYPLLPWLVLALFGALVVQRDGGGAHHARRWFLLLAPFAVAMAGWHALAAGLDEHAAELAPFLGLSWQPTSLPFVLQIGAFAAAVVVGLQWWQRAAGLPRAVGAVGAVGRASLTHYLAHIALVYAPMRLWWPDEDWSFAVGFAAAAGYTVLALVASALWFQRFRQGPIEALWALASR